MKKIAYVAHCLSQGNQPENRRRASLWCAWLCQNFEVATVADWIVMSSVLEETPENRELGLSCDFALIERCDIVLLVGPLISFGMHAEAECAVARGVPVVDLTGRALPGEVDQVDLTVIIELLTKQGITRRAT